MKKILITFFLLITPILQVTYAGNCSYSWSPDTTTDEMFAKLQDCKPSWIFDSDVTKSVGWIFSISTNKWYQIDTARYKIVSVTEKLVILAMLLAIWGLVYAGFQYVTAYWDDWKNKKAKDAVKWSLIWFFVAIISQQLVNAVINLIYEVSNK